MNEEDIRRLQAEAMEKLKQDMARAEALADPLRVRRKLFAVQLAEARYRRGVSQAELASKLGMRQPYISNIENAKGNPTLHTLLRIAGALDVSLMLE